MTKNILAKRQN